MKHDNDKSEPVILPTGQGRVYNCGTMTHDFRNGTGKRTGILNFYIPGGFERNMPEIVKWFAANK